MRLTASPIALLAALLLGACASQRPALSPADIGARWHQQVADVAAGADTAARGAAIRQRLEALGLQVVEQPFASAAGTGLNLVADAGGSADAPLLLIGAHYDRVAVGQGATDNASGVAAVLELAAALKVRPLAKHRVQVAFWDLEERGLLGSQAWIRAAPQKPALYVNFDVFGWGDTLWMMTPKADGPLTAETAAAAATGGLLHRSGAAYPPTDHRAFLQANLPAVSYSLVENGEIDGILLAYGLAPVDRSRAPAGLPKVAQVIHTPRDTMAEVDATHVPRALKVIEEALRAWDAR